MKKGLILFLIIFAASSVMGQPGPPWNPNHFAKHNLNIYNVKSYGAVGDSATDDRAAIMAAIQAVVDNGGGILVFPDGTYRIGTNDFSDSALYIPWGGENVWLLGYSARIVTDIRLVGGAMFVTWGRQFGADSVVWCKNIKIEGFTFHDYGQGRAQANTSIGIAWTDGFEVKNCRVERSSFKGAGTHWAKNGVFDNVHIDSAWYSGIQIEPGTNDTLSGEVGTWNVTVRNCYVGFVDSADGDSTLPTQSGALGAGCGIVATAGSIAEYDSLYGVHIINNTIDSVRDHKIHFFGVAEAEVSGNIVEDKQKSFDIAGYGQLRLYSSQDDGATDSVGIYYRHDDWDEEPITMFRGWSTDNLSELYIGGGRGDQNAVELLKFYTGAGDVATTGGLRMLMDSSQVQLTGVPLYLYESAEGNFMKLSRDTNDWKFSGDALSKIGWWNDSLGAYVITFDGGSAGAKVGINDNTPSYTLDVNGTARFTGVATIADFLLTTGGNDAAYDPTDVPANGDQLTWNTDGTTDWQAAGGGGGGADADSIRGQEVQTVAGNLEDNYILKVYVSGSDTTLQWEADAGEGGALTYFTEADDNDTSVFTATGPNTTVGLNDQLTLQGNPITGVNGLALSGGIITVTAGQGLYGASGAAVYFAATDGGETRFNFMNAPGSKTAIYDSLTEKWYFDTDTLRGDPGSVIKGLGLLSADSIGATNYTDASVESADLASDAHSAMGDSARAAAADSIALALRLAGGTMAGDAAWGDNDITGVNKITADTVSPTTLIIGGDVLTELQGGGLNVISNALTVDTPFVVQIARDSLEWTHSANGAITMATSTDSVGLGGAPSEKLTVDGNISVTGTVDGVDIAALPGATGDTADALRGEMLDSAQVELEDQGIDSAGVHDSLDVLRGEMLDSAQVELEDQGVDSASLHDSLDVVRGEFPDSVDAITDQGIDGNDIDSTSENFAFDGAYHITTAVADSAFMSKKYIDDAAGGLTNQSVKGDHVDSTAENFVFDDAYEGTSAEADSQYSTHNFVRVEIEDTLDEAWTALGKIEDDTASWIDHVADNTQAHSDYLLNSESDGFTGNLSGDGVVADSIAADTLWASRANFDSLTLAGNLVTSGLIDTVDVANLAKEVEDLTDDSATWSDHAADNSQAHTDYMLNTGDIATGVYDFGGATSLEIPNANDPATTVEGQGAWDANNDMLEFYDGAASVIVAGKARTAQIPIDDPDNLSQDTVMFLNIRAENFPFGITITDIGIVTAPSSSYSVTFYETTEPDWSGTESTIEAVATSTSKEAEDNGTIDDGAIAAGSFVMIVLPATDISRLQCWMTFYVNPGN